MTIKRSQAKRGLRTLTRLLDITNVTEDTEDARALLAYIRSVVNERPQSKDKGDAN